MTDDTADYVALTRLQAAYADAVTRRAWGDLEPLFAPDARVEVDTVSRPLVELTGATELGRFIATAIERFEFFELVVLNTVLDIDPAGTANGRMWMVELRQERESGEWSNAFGLYRDDYVRLDGRWRFAGRRYRSRARKVGTDPATVFGLPDPG